jgi:hypothetical protein
MTMFDEKGNVIPTGDEPIDENIARTEEEIKLLKAEWLARKDFELENARGFKDHYKELLEFRKYHERKEREFRQNKEKLAAAVLNMPVYEYRKWIKLKNLHHEKKIYARNMLCQALFGTEHVSQEQFIFVDIILTYMIDASSAKSQADKIFNNYNPTNRK